MSELSVLGLIEGVRAFPRIVRRADDVAALARRERPDVAVLIDSWGFSLRVAQRLRRLDPPIHVIKYVGPQVWASRPGRARTLAGAVDRLLSTQSMDAPYYAGLGLPVTFVGNPALTMDVSGADGARGRASLGVASDQPLLLILPGSRASEVARLTEPFGAAAAALAQAVPGLAVCVAVAPTVADQVKAAVASWPVPIRLVESDAGKLDVMAGCTAALAASGTVSTELALCGAPMVIGYRISDISYTLLKPLMRTRFVTLLNIAADREIAPERLQARCTAEELVGALVPLFLDPELRRRQIADQAEALVIMGLGEADPSERAADAVLADLNGRSGI
jgi:lipid-A-disaccharide synthase